MRGGSPGTAAGQSAVRNVANPDPPATPPPGTPPPPANETPVETLNRLLTRLGYDPTAFQARVTSTRINYPGLTYDYPLLEVTVNGERVGFHLPSATNDLRMTAANISAMLGRPVMNFSAFA